MKVAVNSLFLIPGEVGGSETYFMETVRAVLRDHPGVELAFITNRENHEVLRRAFASSPACSFHGPLVAASNRCARIVVEQTGLPHRLRRIRPDVLWSPGYTMPAFAPCPQVVSILDMQYRTHPDDLGAVARWTTHALISMAVRRADRILTISEFSRREIVRETGCPGERIDVTHLGADALYGREIPADQRREARLRLLGVEAPFILSVAHSYPHKNLALLVEAFTAAAADLPHHLVLVGKARRGEPALRAALALSPAGRVHRIAGLATGDLAALYQSCSVFAFPSLYEGFGLPVLEALAAGVPVLATGEGSTRDVGGEAVAYAAGRDRAAWTEHLVRLATLPDAERARLREAGRRRAASFTWASTASATVDAWTQAARNGLA